MTALAYIPEVVVAKTLIDIDEKLLAAAAKALGTKTKKDTVNAALADVLRRRAVARHMEAIRSGVFADLLDPEVMKGAWR